MWRDSYSLGVKLIDEQHKELFRMAEQLLNVVQNGTGDRREECSSAIAFLKEYTLQHFKDEEEFQKSINYSGLVEHVKIHKRLVQEVLMHERKLILSNFSMNDIRDFIGMIIAWLVCHVAGDDQMIIAGDQHIQPAQIHSPIDSLFHISTCDILSKVAGMSIKDIKVIRLGEGIFQPTVSVSFNLKGDVTGTVTYNYTQQLAFNLMKSMASFSPPSIDELVRSAMTEISDFTSVKSIGLMYNHGLSGELERPDVNTLPAFIPSQSSIILDTGMGVLELDVALT